MISAIRCLEFYHGWLVRVSGHFLHLNECSQLLRPWHGQPRLDNGYDIADRLFSISSLKNKTELNFPKC